MLSWDVIKMLPALAKGFCFGRPPDQVLISVD